jgi:hypothetical protein
MTTEESHSNPLYCYNHPDRETYLRCNRCERPICGECSILTPTGYRCKECVRGLQKVFETAKTQDYILGGLVAFFLSLIGSYIASFLGFFTIFVAPIAGFIIAEAVRVTIRRRRAPLLFKVVAGAAAAGSLPLLLPMLIGGLMMLGGGSLYGLLPLVWQIVYTVLVTTTVYYRLSGIQIR